MASAVLDRLLVLLQFSLDPKRCLSKQISLNLSQKQARAQIKTISHYLQIYRVEIVGVSRLSIKFPSFLLVKIYIKCLLQ